MEKELFQYSDYKDYINDFFHSKPGRGRGMQSALAAHLKCQTSFVSQVLKGEAHLNLEQALHTSRFLSHTDDESDFFMLLVQFTRSSTPDLKKHFEKQMGAIRDRRFVLKKRLDPRRGLTDQDQATYYSAWYYAAIHVILTIEKLNTVEAISAHFDLSPRLVSKVLEFLVSIGLADSEGRKFKITETKLYLGSEAAMIAKHHANWRVHAIRSLDAEDVAEDLHYSSVVSVSKDDWIKLKTDLFRAIEKANLLVNASKHESEILCFAMDLFRI